MTHRILISLTSAFILFVTSQVYGQDWSLVNRGAKFASPRALGSHEQFFVLVGESGSVGVSTNGGEDWKATTEAASLLNTVHVLTDQQALIGGNGGALLLTTNGGGSWIKLPSGRHDDFLSVTGSNGKVILTTSTGAIAFYEGEITPFTQVADEAIYASAIRNDTSVVVSTSGKVYRKPGGSGWEQISSIEGAVPRQLIFHNGLWWVAGDTRTLFSSSDLITWVKHDVAVQLASTALRVGVIDDGSIIALASEESQLLAEAYLFNGQTWQQNSPFEPSMYLRSVHVSSNALYTVTSQRIYRVESVESYYRLYEVMSKAYADVEIGSGLSGYAVGTLYDPKQDFLSRASSFIEKTSDGGITWSDAFKAEKDLKVKSVAALQSGWAIVGADSGKYLLTLDGQSWDLKQLPATNQVKFVAASQGGDVYALVHPNILFHSTDMGQTFALVPSQPSTVGVLDLELLQSGEIRVLETKAMKMSTDKGGSWTTRQLDVPMTAFASMRDTVFYASTVSGQTTIYRSINEGQVLEPAHVMSFPMQVFDIAIQGLDNVVVAAHSSWTLRSSDGGRTWIEQRLAGTPEVLAAASATSQGYVIVGNNGSVWQLSLVPSSVKRELDESVHIFPNPTADVLHIADGTEWQSVKILDMLGRTMLQMDLHNSNTLDLTNLPRGSYLLVLESPDGIHHIKLQKL